MRHLFLIFYLLFIALPLAATPRYEDLVIQRITIVGADEGCAHLDEEQLVTRFKIRKGDLFSHPAFDADLKMLSQDYAKVEPTLEVVDGKLEITLKLFSRPKIRSIVWMGNQHIQDKVLQKELAVTLCSRFDKDAFNKAFHKVKAFYLKKGYFEAELSYDVQLDTLTNEVDITINVCEGRSGHIQSIFFEGFCPEEEEDILDLMVTKKFHLLTSWMSNEGTYNEDAVQYDQIQIVNYLQNKGYADAQVVIEVCEARWNGRINLYIRADRGPYYTLGKISFAGNSCFPDEQIENWLHLTEGDCFSPEKLREAATRVERLYGRSGYIDASVSFEPKLELECGHVYSVDFSITEGIPFRVGMIRVFGNCTTQTNVILHETLLVPGELFNTTKLELTEVRLKNIGYFTNVNVYAVRGNDDTSTDAEGNSCRYRDVYIEVEETQTGRFGAFLGYSSVESIFGGLSLTEKNFNSAGLCSLFCQDNHVSLRGGGEFLNGTIKIGQKARAYDVSWTKPYFLDTPWSVGFDFDRSSNRYISNDYDIEAMGYTLRANYTLNAFMRFGWHYRIRHTNVYLSGSAFRDEELYKASRIHGLISASGVSLSYDSTDRIEFPSRGFKSVAETEVAGIGGDHSFFGIAYLNSYYIPADEHGVLKLRADWRFLQPFGGTHFNSMPLDERLFLGGDNVMRGYKSYKVGPQFEKSKDPKGGLSMQIYSIEYRRPLFSSKRMEGFLFFDGGHLSDKTWHFGRVSLSAGFGARVRVLDSFPPVTLGLGFPINPQNRNQVKNFFISFGATF